MAFTFTKEKRRECINKINEILENVDDILVLTAWHVLNANIEASANNDTENKHE